MNGNSSIEAAKLEAIMRVMLGCETEDELAVAREQARQISAMTPEEIQALSEGHADE